MPIDTREPSSPGWWLQRLGRKLNDRRPRLEKLDAYFRGDPPLPEGAQNAREAYQAFQKKSRTNYAELIVEAARERMQLAGFRTAAGGDENGDELARDIARGNALEVEAAEVHCTMLELGDAYTIVGPPDEETGMPVITAEDPREVVTEHDPTNQRRVRAGLKVFHDDEFEQDLAYVYLPASRPGEGARRFVAARDARTSTLGRNLAFSGRAWNWVEDKGGADGERLPFDRAPVVRFRNRRGVGDFERHTDLLDRINHMLLQRLVIATMQAFRQRAIKGELPSVDPDTGEEIDYDEMFVADPGAFWKLPDGVDLWESQTVDLRPVLDSVRDDVKDLSAVTRTPMYYFSPDAANGSAEGASLSREGLVYRAEDRRTRAAQGWQATMSLAFLWLGDDERAQAAAIEPMWLPVERLSLAERYDAASKAPAAGVTWRTVMTDVLQFSPDTVGRMETERADDQLRAAGLAPTFQAPGAASA